MTQRLMTPQNMGLPNHYQYRNYKNKHDVQLEKIPFDESSKYLDSAFDGEKEHTLNRQFVKHARDTYKCYCTVCLATDSNQLEEKDIQLSKTARSFYFGGSSSASPVKRQAQTASTMNNSMGHETIRGRSLHHQEENPENGGVADQFGQTTVTMGSATATTRAASLNQQQQQSQQQSTFLQQNSQLQPIYQINSMDHDTELCFILKRLVPPARVTRTLRIYIPETVIFWNNEAKLLIYNNAKDNMLKFVRQKEKLNLNELRKFLNDRRTKYRQTVDAKIEEQRLFGLSQSRYVKRNMDAKAFETTPAQMNISAGVTAAQDQQQQPQQQQQNTVTIAETQQAGRRMSDLSKFSQSKVSPQKLAQENSRKALKSQEAPPTMSAGGSMINDPNTNSLAGSPNKTTAHPGNLQSASGSVITLNPMYGSGNNSPAPFGAAGLNGGGERVEKETKDAVVYKVDSMNEFESNQTIVINETDFLVLMMKRKIDPIWTHIHYLQNFVRVKRTKFEFQHFQFEYETAKDDELFVRAFRDIQMLNGEISSVSSEYVSPEAEEEFEQNLMYEHVTQYQLYMICKIFHFLQTFHSVTLLGMETEWLIDDIGTLILINCKNIGYAAQGRTYITTEMYFKRIEEQAEKKLKLKEGLEEKYKDHRKEAIAMFSNAILDNYEAKKAKLGIFQQKKVRQEIDISDEVFERICPEIKFKLSDLLRTNAPIRVLQREILGEKEKTLRERNEIKNSQMFSKVYSSPQKISPQKKQEQIANASALTQSSMRQTFSILTKIDPPHRRVINSAHQTFRQKSHSLYVEETRNNDNMNNSLNISNGNNINNNNSNSEDFRNPKHYTTPQRNSSSKKSQGNRDSDLNIQNLFNSPSIKLVATIESESSTTKKLFKVKKKTLPFYLFCSPQH